MRWSKLRTSIEALMAESVRGRVGLRVTRYRRCHDQDGRAWITLDGKEIVNMPRECKLYGEMHKRAAFLAGEKSDSCSYDLYKPYMDEAERQLHEEGVFWQGDLGDAMFYAANMPIAKILSSESALVRALGMLDRRLGKRRLAALDMSKEAPLVRLLYEFRCEAEGLKPVRGQEPA
jgi:hypothetical protein